MAQSLLPANRMVQQWDYLVAVLNAEAGLGAAPAGTTPGTRLTGIRFVGKSWQQYSTLIPSISVQLQRYTEDYTSKSLRAGTNRHATTTTFEILVACRSNETTAAANQGANFPPNLDDAMGQVRAFVLDGNGNGLDPILRDPQYRTLGITSGIVNACRSQISSIVFDHEVRPGTKPVIWAYALVTVIAEAIVGIG